MIVKDFLDKLNTYIPRDLSLSFDNVGLLVGNEDNFINKIYVCLDVTEKIIDKAIHSNIDTIITHHPIIFSPIKSITNKNIIGKKLIKCIENNITVISYHTNLDAVTFGMNEKLVEILDLKYKRVHVLNVNDVDKKSGIGRIVYLEEEMYILHIIDKIKKIFNIEIVRFADCGKDMVKKICVINGSGNSLIKDCYNENIDLIITGDTTYHTAFDSIENGISIIDLGHFNSENLVYKEVMKRFLKFVITDKIAVHYDSLLTDVYKYV